MADSSPALIAVGGSAGSIDALLEVLPRLTTQTPPVVAALHLSARAPSLLSQVFGHRCAVCVRDAEQGMRATRGTVTFAPPDYHLLVERDGRVSLSVDDLVRHSRPSIDVLFESVADAFGPRALAVLLSGASEDGAAGAAAVRRRGGTVWIQDPSTAQSDTMPRGALRAVADAAALSPSEIGRRLSLLRARAKDGAPG